MKTYKLGNKVKCIIRSYTSGRLGDMEMDYGNQPYTVLNDVSATMTFSSYGRDAEAKGLKELSYNVENISEIKLSNITLTNKILNLIFLKNETKLCNSVKNYGSDENNQIFLQMPQNELYQVFVYDDDGNLEQAYGTLDTNVLTVEKANSDYLIFYSFIGNDCLSLDRQNNTYVSLDFEITGNEEDETLISWIHIDKCAVSINKNMYFSGTINDVDLTFKVINTGNDYITLK